VFVLATATRLAQKCTAATALTGVTSWSLAWVRRLQGRYALYGCLGLALMLCFGTWGYAFHADDKQHDALDAIPDLTQGLGDWVVQASGEVKKVGDVLLDTNDVLQSALLDKGCLGLDGDSLAGCRRCVLMRADAC